MYLPLFFLSKSGINVIDCINDLIGTVADFYGIEVETVSVDEEEESEEATGEDASEENASDEAEESTAETK